MIECTPYEAQFGKKPTQTWRRFINNNIVEDDPIVDPKITHLRIKKKRESQAEKNNKLNKLTSFIIGDLVLLRICPTSDALSKVITKFCTLHQGPYKVKEVRGPATYVLEDLGEENRVRGIFNVRQLKRYRT